MSLGQRLHNQLEKKFEGQQNDVEQLQTVIRQLKLLSKSQSTLLKAYLQEKLNNASSLVTKASTYLDTKNDSKAQELKNGLKALKLEEIEVDVTSTKVALQEELTKLRIAIENNGSLPAASNGAPPPSSMTTNSLVAGAGSNAKDLKKITDLETENAKLSQQIAELKNDLIVANQASNNNAKTSQQSNGNQEELNRLRQENESLNSKVKDLSVSLEKKSAELSDSETRIADLSRKANDTTKEKTLQSEIDKLRGQLQEEKQSKVTLQKELETRYQQKMYELNGLNEQKLKEKEEEWAAEREEMEVALAQELEEVERVKDEEIQSLQSQITILQKKIKQLQTMNANLFSSLQKVSEKMRSLQRDYKSTFANTKREIQQTMGSIKGEYGGTLVQKIITLGQEMAQINKKYLREMSERKRLHNVVQELKGNIRVYLRCRPPTAKEVETFGNDALCVSFPNPGEIKVFNSEKNREKTWEFDEVFDTNTTQEQVYSDVSALVTSVLDGYNVCIFAYGQTGSGKTHTMSGPPSNPGVNTRALEELFQKTQDRAGEWVDNISVCILEVYNEDIRDLLDDKNDEKLEVKMGEYGNYVPGLTQIPVQTMEQVLQLIQKADRVRSSATTNMNEHSSRSHMMLTVTVVSEFLPTKLVTRGKLNLVDLAGSERVNKSGAQGQALKEAQNINKSLFALGDVIAARAQKNAHIPFRNSTLTFLLQDSLSQDSKTLMIVCISPILYNCEETTCSLNFAAKVKTVELGRASKNVQSAGSSTKSTGSVGVGAPSAGKRPGIGK